MGLTLGRVPSYLVETYLARGAAGERAAREWRARSVAERLTREGTRVRFEGSIHVPEDEICFFTFEVPTARDAALVAQSAGLDPLRVVETAPFPAEDGPETDLERGAPAIRFEQSSSDRGVSRKGDT